MKISKRFNKNIDTDEYYRFSKLTNEKNKIKKISERKILDLGIGDPNTFPPIEVINEIKNKMDQDDTHCYSDNGIKEFRYKISNHLGVNYEKVTHTMGIKEALCILSLIFVDKDDYIIMSNPSYNIIANMSKWLKGKIYYLPLKEENDFEINFDDIPKYILKRTKLMYLNYPNNPTGKIATKELYEKALLLAKKYNFMVINDNAYGDLIYNEKDIVNLRDMPLFKDYGIELYSFSKAYNMTGYRIGYILSNERLIKIFQNVKDNIDSGQFIPIQYGAMKALECHKFLIENKKKYYNRQLKLYELLKEFKFNYEIPKAGFFAYVKIPKYIDDIKMDNAYKCSMYLLKKYGIMTIPYDEYGSYLRLSLIFKEEEEFFFSELRKRLKEMKITF